MKEKEPPPPNLDFQMDPEEEEMYFQVRGCGWGVGARVAGRLVPLRRRMHGGLSYRRQDEEADTRGLSA